MKVRAYPQKKVIANVSMDNLWVYEELSMGFPQSYQQVN